MSFRSQCTQYNGKYHTGQPLQHTNAHGPGSWSGNRVTAKLTATYENSSRKCKIKKDHSTGGFECNYQAKWKGPKCELKTGGWMNLPYLKCIDVYGYDHIDFNQNSWRRTECINLLNDGSGFGSHLPK